MKTFNSIDPGIDRLDAWAPPSTDILIHLQEAQ
jgi:hypothetical protein